MCDQIDAYKTQAHALIDTLYESLTTRAEVPSSRQVCTVGRIYSIVVKGDYDRVLLTVEDEWGVHVITYDSVNDCIELRGDTFLFQKALTKWVEDYESVTQVLDDLISLLERWVEATQISTTKETLE